MKSSGAWLVSEGRVLASAEIAADSNSRRRGLIGRDHLDGAIIISRCRWIHTFGMKSPYSKKIIKILVCGTWHLLIICLQLHPALPQIVIILLILVLFFLP